jgi:hypothetical protein
MGRRDVKNSNNSKQHLSSVLHCPMPMLQLSCWCTALQNWVRGGALYLAQKLVCRQVRSVLVEWPISGVFLFPCLKILLGHSNWWTECNHNEPSMWCTRQLRGQRNSLCFSSTLVSSVVTFHHLPSFQSPPPPLTHSSFHQLAHGQGQNSGIFLLFLARL